MINSWFSRNVPAGHRQGPNSPVRSFFLTLYSASGTFWQLFQTHLHACSKIGRRRTQVWAIQYAWRQYGTGNKPGLCERFDQTGKVCSLYNCRNMQTLGIHQARSASTWHLSGLLKGVRGPVIGWGFKESFRDGWFVSSLGDGAMDLK